MRWYYQDDKVITIKEIGDKYVTEIHKPEFCVVYCDSNKKPEPKTGSMYARQQLRDLHVIFGNDIGNVPSNWTPHKESKNPAKINKIDFDRSQEYKEEGAALHLNVSQDVKKIPTHDTNFGAFNLTLTRRRCDSSGHTSGFASWYCQEAKDIFLDFDCNFWFRNMSNFVVPTPKIEVTYDGIPKTSRTSAQSKDPTQPSSPVQQTNYSPPLQLHKPQISNVVLHMPAASVLESELEPKKRRKAAKIFDSTQDAPGPLKAFKLCEDSTVAPGPTKRLKLVSTDDSGRASE
jgi:hypothetical protein